MKTSSMAARREKAKIELDNPSVRPGPVGASDGLLQVHNQGVSEAFQLVIKLRFGFTARYSLAIRTVPIDHRRQALRLHQNRVGGIP